MKIKYLLFLGFILSSCVRVENEGRGFISEHIINGFINLSAIELKYNEHTENNGLFYIECNGEYADKETRERLWKEYDDYHYNKVKIEPLVVSMNDFVKIDVTSDQDFNDVSAGSSLATKVRLIALSPYKWLMSGGTKTFSWNQMPSDYAKLGYLLYEIPEVFPVNGFLSEITSEDLKLLKIFRALNLLFVETPDIKKHNITVSFEEKDKSFSSSVEYIFQ